MGVARIPSPGRRRLGICSSFILLFFLFSVCPIAAYSEAKPRMICAGFFHAQADEFNGATASIQERNPIAEVSVLRVVTLPDTPPLSWFEEGIHKGAYADILTEISQDVGLRFEVIPTSCYEESLEMLHAGEADVILPFSEDFAWAEQNNVQATASFISLNYSLVTRDSWSNDPLGSIAIVKGSPYASELSQEWAPTQLECASEQEALEALLQGRADAALVNTYLAEWAIRKNPNRLTASLVSTAPNRLGIGMRADLPHPVYALMEEAVASLNPELVTHIVYDHAMFQVSSMSLNDFIRRFPELSVGLTCLLLGLVIAALALYLWSNRRHEAMLSALAYQDERTGLWNLNGFERQARELLEKEQLCRYAVISLDMDSFTLVTEQYNRAVGYSLVAEIASALREVCGPGTVAGRVKSDHFLVLHPWNTRDDLEHFIDRLNRRNVRYEEGELVIPARFNFGVSLLEDGDREITAAIDCADIALHEVHSSSSRLVYFNPELEHRLQLQRRMEDTMRDALAAGEFEVYYQPQVNIFSGALIGAEALVRWNSPKLGFLSPGDFIHLFEHNAFIHDLDLFVLEKVCQTVYGWLKRGLTPVPISVNQSRLHFEDQHYLERLKAILCRQQAPSELIKLEITESCNLGTLSVADTLADIRSMGLHILVDDFGSEYSSLPWIGSIPVDMLKLDRSFLLESNHADVSRTILRKVVETARELSISVICEGVETFDQAQFLLSIGCDLAQGYYYAKPMPLLDFETDWLKRPEGHRLECAMPLSS